VWGIFTGIKNVKREFDARRFGMGKCSMKVNRNIRRRVKLKSVWLLIFKEWQMEDMS
jgi:hypothetical protein